MNSTVSNKKVFIRYDDAGSQIQWILNGQRKNFKNKGPNFWIRGSDTWNKQVTGISGYVSRYPTAETTLKWPDMRLERS